MSTLKNEVEALLFSSGRKMTVEELAKLCRTRNLERVKEALEELKKEYSAEDKSIMMVQEDDAYKLTVKERYMPVVHKVITQTELRKSIIETLATVAFKAPVKQSEIVKIRSNKAYDHLKELEEGGFITREKCGRTKMIRLG
ncbi:hypothetical protein GF351_01880, partial [Candidatus Woesearchaeota archaeon]|nr:hypothetical protein [Candidatus Woesearchaeota archaeon]